MITDQITEACKKHDVSADDLLKIAQRESKKQSANDDAVLHFLTKACSTFSLSDIRYDGVSVCLALETIKKYSCSTLVEVVEAYGEHEFDQTYVERAKNWSIPIDTTRDELLTSAGLEVLRKSYLLRGSGGILETPQLMWARVATTVATTEEDARLTYERMSRLQMTHASPTLFNSGLKVQQLSSCFVLHPEMGTRGLLDAQHDAGVISMCGGGVGISLHGIEFHGRVAPVLKALELTMNVAEQNGGKRNGRMAAYFDPCTSAIFELLDIHRNDGKDDERCHDIYTALWVPNIFMDRALAGEEWTLFSNPKIVRELGELWGDAYTKRYLELEAAGGKGCTTVKAHEILQRACLSQAETGRPFLCFKDHANAKSNHQHLGSIKSSNLCVAPETMLLTKEHGNVPIASMRDQEVSVWNGEVWSPVTVRRTNEDAELMRIMLSDGRSVECTPYHKFVLHTDKEIEAQELAVGDKLAKCTLGQHDSIATFDSVAYTHGFFCADGTYGANRRPILRLYGNKVECREYLTYQSTSGNLDSVGRLSLMLLADTKDKYEVPLGPEFDLSYKVSWIAGVLDGDGTRVKPPAPSKPESYSIQLGSIHDDFLKQVQLLLVELGVTAEINFMRDSEVHMLPANDGTGEMAEFNRKPMWRLLISPFSVGKLVKIGLDKHLHRLDITDYSPPKCDATRYAWVQTIERTGRRDETFCFTEPLKHRGVFNGILLGQCTEIYQYTDSNNTAVCNLASIALGSLITPSGDEFDFDELDSITRLIVRNLNNLIDVSYYPTEASKRSNQFTRPIGIGVQGLQDAFFRLNLPFDSEGASDLNRRIFARIYYAAVSESVRAAKELGACGAHEGSPASKGLLQPHLWGETPETLKWSGLDWESLATDVQKHGMRNSLLTALMPTASTSIILGSVAESIEPVHAHVYLRRLMSGESVAINPHLVRALSARGLWDDAMLSKIVEENGSITKIEGIPDDLKRLFRTAYEVSKKTNLQLSRDRAIFVDQGQSTNVHMAEPTVDKLMLYLKLAYEMGLKTAVYYVRQQPKQRAVQFACAGGDGSCTACSA